MIRPMTVYDVPYAASLYEKYMFDSFLSRLGEDFLKILLEGLVASKGICYVYAHESEIAAFITATTNTSASLGIIFKKSGFLMARKTFFSFLKQPRLLILIPEMFLYPMKTRIDDVKAELLFIAIDPQYRNKGIAHSLIDAVLSDLRACGIQKAKVSVMEKNHIVNNLLASCGFNAVRNFNFCNKENILYCRDLTQ